MVRFGCLAIRPLDFIATGITGDAQDFIKVMLVVETAAAATLLMIVHGNEESSSPSTSWGRMRSCSSRRKGGGTASPARILQTSQRGQTGRSRG
jgi:hypothetical protein